MWRKPFENRRGEVHLKLNFKKLLIHKYIYIYIYYTTTVNLKLSQGPGINFSDSSWKQSTQVTRSPIAAWTGSLDSWNVGGFGWIETLLWGTVGDMEFMESTDSTAGEGDEAPKIILVNESVTIIMSTKIPGTSKHLGPPIPILLPYHSHKNPLKYGNDMGGLWGPGVPLLRVPGKIPNHVTMFLLDCWLRLIVYHIYRKTSHDISHDNPLSSSGFLDIVNHQLQPPTTVTIV